MATDNPWGSPNPYLGGLASANQSAVTQTPGLQQNMSQLQNKISSLGGQDSGNGMATNNSYPAYANSYGLGTQVNQQSQAAPQSAAPAPAPAPTQTIPGSPTSQDDLMQALNATAQNVASRGFNPWSLTGEANARGK